jgi:branched-chain amino acid aminotransferase
VLTFDDAHAADEVFLSGNFAKVTSVKAFDGTQYRSRAVTEKVRSLYMDWAASQPV